MPEPINRPAGRTFDAAPWLGERPKSRINGKTNPAYTEWWYAKRGTTAAEARKKWRQENPDKYRSQHIKDESVKAERYHEANKRVHTDECKCVECGMIFKRDDAHIKGFRFIGRYNCICDECA